MSLSLNYWLTDKKEWSVMIGIIISELANDWMDSDKDN